MRTPKRPLRSTIERSFEDLLLGHSPAGHATGCGLHANRGWPEGGRSPESPAASVDRGRGDESPRARAADGGPIVDLDARGEATIGESGGGALDAQLARPNHEFSPVDRHAV